MKSLDVRSLGVESKVTLYAPFATRTSALRNDPLYSHIESQLSEWQKKYVGSRQ